MLAPALTDWQAQYQRMLRTHARLAKPIVSSFEYDDDLRHFFQDCWHLKDWIKNDSSVPLSVRTSIESEVDKSKPLRIAADLANGCKHFHHNRSSREGAYVTSISVTVNIGKGVEHFHTVTLDDGSTVPAQVVANEAVDAWQALLQKFRLALNP
jgi:hypothetical protein